MARSRLHRRYVKNYRPNPPLFTDVAQFVVPGFGGFAATRFLTRIAAVQVARRAPSWGKHAGAVASVSSFLAAWFLAHRWEWLKKHHTPIVVGSAIAAIQSLFQLYLPSVGWMISDASPELAASPSAQMAASDQQLARMNLAPTDEDPNEFVYNDAFDAGRYSGRGGRGSMKTGAIPAPQQGGGAGGGGGDANDLPDPGDAALDDAIGQANLGVFAN